MRESKKTVEKKRFYQSRVFKRDLTLWSMAAIPLIMIFIFSYLPMPGIIVAFKNFKFDKGIWGSEWNGLTNFKYFFQNGTIWRVTWNSIRLNIVNFFFAMPICLCLGIIMFEMKSKRVIKFVQTSLYIPGYITVVVEGFIFYAIFSPVNGIANQILEALGQSGLDWYARPKEWIPIMMAHNLWNGGGSVIVMAYALLMGVDTGMYESAAIDGANFWQRTIYITLPNLQTWLCISVITTVAGITNGNFEIYTLTRNSTRLYETMDNTATFNYRTMMVLKQMGPASAFGLMFSVVGLILLLITNGIVRKIEPDNALV